MMSARQLGMLTGVTLISLVVAMIIIVACSRVSAKRQWIVYTLAYLSALFAEWWAFNPFRFREAVPAEPEDLESPLYAAFIVLVLVLWSYRRKMRKAVSSEAPGLTPSP
jgi:hypothetical protein